MTLKKTAASKRASLPRAADYTKSFLKDWVRLTETLFCFLLVVLGWLVGLFGKRQSLWLGIFIGAAMGIAALVRPSLQFFFLIFSLLLIFHYGWKRGFRFSAAQPEEYTVRKVHYITIKDTIKIKDVSNNA